MGVGPISMSLRTSVSTIDDFIKRCITYCCRIEIYGYSYIRNDDDDIWNILQIFLLHIAVILEMLVLFAYLNQ